MAFNILSSSTNILLSRSVAPQKFEQTIRSLSGFSLPITGVATDNSFPPSGELNATGSLTNLNIFLTPSSGSKFHFKSDLNNLGPDVDLHIIDVGLPRVQFLSSSGFWISSSLLPLGSQVIAITGTLNSIINYKLDTKTSTLYSNFEGCWPILTKSVGGENLNHTAFLNRIFCKVFIN